jgi:parallel beta-helix repeat protein
MYAGARIERSGAPDAWITLRAVVGETVLLDRPGPNNAHESILEVETWEGDGIVAYWVIAGFEVADAPGWGIDIRGEEGMHNHHIVVRSNRVHDNGLDRGVTGIFAAFSDDVIIEGNESYANGEHGIYINNSSDRFVVRGNIVHDNPNCGVHLNGDAEMGGDGVLSEGVVEGNLIYANGVDGGAAINMDGVSNTLVANNLLVDNHASGIALFRENGAICSADNRVYHNTITMPDDGRWGIIISDPACSGNRLINNIVLSAHRYRGAINLAGGMPNGLVSDYNLLSDRFTLDDGESVTGFDVWQALGLDAHSALAESADVFADPMAGDYSLPVGSPAVDAGMALDEVVTDLNGAPRPGGDGADIGAYERK